MSIMDDSKKQERDSLPENCTNAASVYFVAMSKDLALFHFFIDLAVRADYVAFVAKQALESKEWEDIDPVKLLNTNPGPVIGLLRKNRQAFLQMFLARFVDNFQCYLVDLIREILKKQPSILKTRDNSISVERLLNFSSMDEVIHDIIERKVAGLAYQGFGDLEEWCADRGITIVIRNDRKHEIVEIIATRNLIVHSRCLVDDRYVKSVRDSKLTVGQARNLEVNILFNALSLMNNVVRETDQTSAGKFGLDVSSIANSVDEGEPEQSVE